MNPAHDPVGPMKKSEKKYPGLNDIVFEQRNQSYGSYRLRERYTRYLLISLVAGILIFLIAVITPFLVYYFEPVDLYPGAGDMIEYYSIEPPSHEDLAEIARLIAKPAPEETPAPIVSDTVKEEEKKPEEEKPVEKQDSTQVSDSAKGTGPGNSQEGALSGSPDGLYTYIDSYPQFPGGDRARLYFIRTNIRYPEQALKSGIQGVVTLLFVIEIDGSITNIQITKGIGGGCDDEAIRVTRSMPTWFPGKRNGKPVRVMVKMPIVFRIPGKPMQ